MYFPHIYMEREARIPRWGDFAPGYPGQLSMSGDSLVGSAGQVGPTGL